MFCFSQNLRGPYLDILVIKSRRILQQLQYPLEAVPAYHRPHLSRIKWSEINSSKADRLQ